MILLKKTFLLIVLFIGSVLSVFGQDDANKSSITDADLKTEATYVDAVKAGMLDDPKTQEELLKKVVKEKPDEGAPYYDLAKIYVDQKKYDLAEEQIKNAVAINADNIWYQATYAEILVDENKYEPAAAIYKDIANKTKVNKDFLFNAASLYEKVGDYKSSIALLDKLLIEEGTNERILLSKQQLQLRMNDVDGAIKTAQLLIEQNPNEAKYYANLANLYDSNNKPEQSIAIYQKAIKDFPTDPNLQYGLAQYYKRKNDTEKYETYIRKAILNPEFDDQTQASVLLSYIQESSNNPSKKGDIINITKQLAELHPDNAQILNIYGEVLFNNNELFRATFQYKKAIQIDPSRFNAWQKLLIIYANSYEIDSLIKYSEKALRYFPNQGVVHYLNGVGHYYTKEFSTAIKSFNRAIDLQPEDNTTLLSDIYSALGDTYNKTKQYQLSDSCFEKSLTLNPKNATVLNNYSYYLSVRNVRLGDAENMSKRSLELRPKEATFLDTYGWILYQEGKYEQAKKYIQEAIDSSEIADGTLFDHLGDVLYKLNEKDKAVENWKKAKEKGVENKFIDKKIQEGKLYE